MNKVALVAIEEIRRTVFKKSFLLVLFSVPLFLIMMIAPGAIFAVLQERDAPIGYVDLAGIFADPRPLPITDMDRPFAMIAYESEREAGQALEAGEIQAYFVLHPDFGDTRRTDLVYRQEPDSDALSAFYDFLQLNLLADLPAEVAWRAADRVRLTIRNPAGTREFPEGAPQLGSVLPLALGMAFGGLLLVGSGSLMTGLTDEKSNRTIEVMTTSISPERLVTGKIIGILIINLIQLVFWIAVGAAAIWLAGDVLGVEWFQHVRPDWLSMIAVAAVALPGYLFAAAVMFAIGATVVEPQEGQAIGPLLFLALMAPIYALVAIANDPHGALAVTLTLLPLTSVLTVALRSLLAVIPPWQLVASVGIQLLCGLAALWLAGRAFRLGMLRYGQRLRLAEILGRTSAGTG